MVVHILAAADDAPLRAHVDIKMKKNQNLDIPFAVVYK
jgi:hypothetical protein